MCKAVILSYAGTAVFQVKVEADGKKKAPDSATGDLVIKLSWQLKDRRSEVEILKHLHRNGISSVPYVVASEDLTGMRPDEDELKRMTPELHGKIQGIIGSDIGADHRIYRAIVMKPFLVHLTTIAEWTTFYDAFKGLIDGEVFPSQY